LARFVGLENVGQKVRDIIKRVQDKINAAMNKLIEYVAQQGNSWLAKAGVGRQNTARGSKTPAAVPAVPVTPRQAPPAKAPQRPAPPPKGSQRPAPPPKTPQRPGVPARQPQVPQRPGGQAPTNQNQRTSTHQPQNQQQPTPHRQGQNNRQPIQNQLGDGEVGKMIHFSVNGENHRQWIEVLRTLVRVMVASRPGPVEVKLNEWEGQLGKLEEHRAEASRLLGVAKDRLGITQREAIEAAKQKLEADRNPTKQASDEFIKADNETEATQERLVDVLKRLFEIFGEKDSLSSEALTLAKERFGKQIFEADELKQFLMNELKITDRTADRKISDWKKDKQLFEIEYTKKRTFDGNSELVTVSALDAAKKHFDNQVFTREQLLEFMENTRRIATRTTDKLIQEWKTQNPRILFTYESDTSKGNDRQKIFSFNEDLLPEGARPVSPNNRAVYGYVNPKGESPERLKILVKGLIIEEDPNSPTGFKHNYKRGRENDWEYLKTDARFRCVAGSAPGQELELKDVIIGHIPGKGVVEHWNGDISGFAPGHTQTYEENKTWNQNPDNYHGPEEKDYSSKTGGESMNRYIVPGPHLVPPSNRMWWDPKDPNYKKVN